MVFLTPSTGAGTLAAMNSNELPKVTAKMARAGITTADVARRAFEIYLAEADADGCHERHWARAESELQATLDL